jgi:hypothetical protein
MQKRYWLRGGIIISVLYLVLAVAAIFGSHPNAAAVNSINMISPAQYFIPYNILGNMPLVFFIGFFFWFVIGVVLGWLYGKIKNRNKVI